MRSLSNRINRSSRSSRSSRSTNVSRSARTARTARTSRSRSYGNTPTINQQRGGYGDIQAQTGGKAVTLKAAVELLRKYYQTKYGGK